MFHYPKSIGPVHSCFLDRFAGHAGLGVSLMQDSFQSSRVQGLGSEAFLGVHGHVRGLRLGF